MCWSATADLVARTGIAAVGAAAVAVTLHRRRARDLPLAALPLLLGAHQIVESAVWHSGGGAGPATTAWAVIALPVLALWVPCGVLLAAPPENRRRLLVPAAAVGAATAAALALRLAGGTVTAEVRRHTVGYAVDLPYAPLLIAAYLVATVGALLLAADRALRTLGLLVAGGAVVCALLWNTAFVSTWCAVAAVASVTLLAWTVRGPRSPAASAARPAEVPAVRSWVPGAPHGPSPPRVRPALVRSHRKVPRVSLEHGGHVPRGRKHGEHCTGIRDIRRGVAQRLLEGGRRRGLPRPEQVV
jgi:hypothetical protein